MASVGGRAVGDQDKEGLLSAVELHPAREQADEPTLSL
jgi:hypothetical protein